MMLRLFEGRRPMEWSETRRLSQVQESIVTEEGGAKEQKRKKGCEKREKTEVISMINLLTKGTMPEQSF